MQETKPCCCLGNSLFFSNLLVRFPLPFLRFQTISATNQIVSGIRLKTKMWPGNSRTMPKDKDECWCRSTTPWVWHLHVRSRSKSESWGIRLAPRGCDCGIYGIVTNLLVPFLWGPSISYRKESNGLMLMCGGRTSRSYIKGTSLLRFESKITSRVLGTGEKNVIRSKKKEKEKRKKRKKEWNIYF